MADTDSVYMCDCGAEMPFEGSSAPSRCTTCGRDVDVRKIKKAGLAPMPANLWPVHGVQNQTGESG